MGRTRPRTSKKATKVESKTAPPASKPELELEWHELLVKAAQEIASLEYEGAKASAQQAVVIAERKKDSNGLRDSLEVLGTVELELGELDQAREHFLASIQHATTLPDPSPAPHLYLAQLSTPEESLTHFSNALTLLQAKIAAIEKIKLGGDGSAGTEEDVEEEEELRRSASRALVGMTELYLTDLCYEAEAEQNCEKHLALAASIDPSDPEVYQTLASVRLSQQRNADAQEAALRGWSLWRKIAPESPDYPLPSTRLSLAKIFVELSLLEEALQVLQMLEMEDDEDGEVWYLSGWSWWLLGEKRGSGSSIATDAAAGSAGVTGAEEKESKEECWSEAKLCFENYLRLHEFDPTSSDPEQLQHVNEMNSKLTALGVVASAGHEEGMDEWEDEGSEDDDDDEEGDVQMES